MSNVSKNDPNKEVNIFCITLTYNYKDGRTEKSQPKYCGNSQEHCYEAISKLLGACRSVVPESVGAISFSIEGYCRDSYVNSCGADLVVPAVVDLLLRNDNESPSKE